MHNAAQVYRFLAETGRIDPPRGAWIESSGLLDLRYEMLTAWLAINQDLDVDLSRFSSKWVKKWERQNHLLVEREGSLPLLKWVKSQVSNWSNIDMDDIAHNQRFLLCRANPEHPDRYLVNRLISEFLPFDYMTLFAFNKPRFYKLYEDWPGNYRDFVVNQLASTYLKNKKRMRKKLYR